MKVEFEITDEQISKALDAAFKSPRYNQASPVQEAVNRVVEKEIADIISNGAFKEQLVATIRTRIDDMASQRILTLTAHLIRQQVKTMSESGELDSAIRGAILKANPIKGDN